MENKTVHILARGRQVPSALASKLSSKLITLGYCLASSIASADVICVGHDIDQASLNRVLPNGLSAGKSVIATIDYVKLIIDGRIKPCDAPDVSAWSIPFANTKDIPSYNYAATLPPQFPRAFLSSAQAMVQMCKTLDRENTECINLIPVRYRNKAAAMDCLPPLS